MSKSTAITAGIPTGRRIVTASARKPDGCSYAAVKEAAWNGAVLHVRHYYFRGSGGEWLAEQDHISLIDAYDELAQKYGIPGFTRRKDVELQGEYKFRLKNAKAQ